MGPWVKFINEKISPPPEDNIIHDGFAHIQSRDHTKTKRFKDYQQRKFRIVYTMVFILTQVISNAMEDFQVHCNLENMKYNTACINICAAA